MRRLRELGLRRLGLPAVLALSVLAAACGGSSGASTDGVASAANGSKAKTASDDGKKSDPQQAGLDFARCMREHGVDMPDPTSDGGMVVIGPGAGAGHGSVRALSEPPAGFEEADKACRHFLEDMIGDGGGPLDPQEQDRALKFAQCMREHGVDMPDPDFSGGRVQIKITGGFEPGSPTVEAAHKACGAHFGPGVGPAPAPGVGRRS